MANIRGPRVRVRDGEAFGGSLGAGHLPLAATCPARRLLGTTGGRGAPGGYQYGRRPALAAPGRSVWPRGLCGALPHSMLGDARAPMRTREALAAIVMVGLRGL
jgi:hypothetical protein